MNSTLNLKVFGTVCIEVSNGHTSKDEKHTSRSSSSSGSSSSSKISAFKCLHGMSGNRSISLPLECILCITYRDHRLMVPSHGHLLACS